jgi:hypothetical protein
MLEGFTDASGELGCFIKIGSWAQFGHTQGFTGWEAMRALRKTSMISVPEAGLEPVQD